MQNLVIFPKFGSVYNPIETVVGCNGRELAIGPVDTNDSVLFSVSDLVISSSKLDELKLKLGAERLGAGARRLKSRMATARQTKPAQLMNQQLFLDRVKPNALAPYLTPLYEMFFRAEDPEKIQLILDRAYDQPDSVVEAARALCKPNRRAAEQTRRGTDVAHGTDAPAEKPSPSLREREG